MEGECGGDVMCSAAPGPENIRAKESLLGLHRPPSVGEFMVSDGPSNPKARELIEHTRLHPRYFIMACMHVSVGENS